jgi:hypothetical protein
MTLEDLGKISQLPLASISFSLIIQRRIRSVHDMANESLFF